MTSERFDEKAKRAAPGFGSFASGKRLRGLGLAVLAAGAFLFGASGGAEAQQKLVIYSANDSTLERSRLRTPSPRRPASRSRPCRRARACSMKRIQAEKDNPQGDIIWGVSRSLLQTNKAYFAPYKSKENARDPARFPRPRQSLDRDQCASPGGDARTPSLSRRARGRRPGPIFSTRNTRARSPSPIRRIRAPPITNATLARRPLGRRRRRLGEAQGALRQHQDSQPLDAGVPGCRHRRICARHLARIRGRLSGRATGRR